MWKVKMTAAFRALARRERFTLANLDALAEHLSANPQVGDFLGSFNGVDARQLRWSKFMVVFEVDETRKTIWLTALTPWSPDLSEGLSFLRLVKKIIFGLISIKKLFDAARELAERYGIDIDFLDDTDDNDNVNRMQLLQNSSGWAPSLLNNLPLAVEIGATTRQMILCEPGLGKTFALRSVVLAVQSQRPVVPEAAPSSANPKPEYEWNQTIAQDNEDNSERYFVRAIKSVVIYYLGNSRATCVRNTTSLPLYVKGLSWNNFGLTEFAPKNDKTTTKWANCLPANCFFLTYSVSQYSYSAKHALLCEKAESHSGIGCGALGFHISENAISNATLQRQFGTRWTL